MVSSQNPTSSTVTESVMGVMRSDRGFIPPEAESTAISAYPSLRYATRGPSFWGGVIAGSLFALSVFVLSWFLMLGCHVGVTQGGLLSMGAGAAWWIIITSCIAFYFGGALANYVSRPLDAEWVKGATVWGLSIPLALCICGIVAAGSGLLGGLVAPHVNVIESASTLGATGGHAAYAGVSFGAIWTGFWTLLLGLIFSTFGSSSILRRRGYSEPHTVTP